MKDRPYFEFKLNENEVGHQLGLRILVCLLSHKIKIAARAKDTLSAGEPLCNESYGAAFPWFHDRLWAVKLVDIQKRVDELAGNAQPMRRERASTVSRRFISNGGVLW